VTPVLQRLSKRREVSSVVAVTPAGQLYARHVRGSVSSPVVIRALQHFRRQIGRPLLVVWDRLNAHRAHRTAAFLARHAHDFAVAYLPAYAPDLNPEELCNARGQAQHGKRTALRHCRPPPACPARLPPSATLAGVHHRLFPARRSEPYATSVKVSN
jgi:hypothetical protein